MRNKKWFSACVAIAVLLISACKVDQVVNVDGNVGGTIIGTRTDSAGNCVMVTDLMVDGLVVGGSLTIQPGEIRNLRMNQRFTPSGCRQPRSFRWESSDSSKVSVIEIDQVTGRVRGIAPGSAVICGIDKEGGSFRLCVTITVAGSTTPPVGASITLSPSSLCFSTLAGSPTTETITVTVANGSLANVVLRSNATGVTVSGSGGSWTATRTGSVEANGSIVATLTGSPNAVASVPARVTSGACTGATSTISYTPSTSTGGVGTSITLSATCVLSDGTPCRPYWTSSDPSRVRVEGTESQVLNGLTFKVGFTATLTRVFAGDAEICVQPSLTITSPRYCGSARHIATSP